MKVSCAECRCQLFAGISNPIFSEVLAFPLARNAKKNSRTKRQNENNVCHLLPERHGSNFDDGVAPTGLP